MADDVQGQGFCTRATPSRWWFSPVMPAGIAAKIFSMLGGINLIGSQKAEEWVGF